MCHEDRHVFGYLQMPFLFASLLMAFYGIIKEIPFIIDILLYNSHRQSSFLKTKTYYYIIYNNQIMKKISIIVVKLSLFPIFSLMDF